MEGLAELSTYFIPFLGFSHKKKQFKSHLGWYHSISENHLLRGFYEIKLLKGYEMSNNGRFLAQLSDLLSWTFAFRVLSCILSHRCSHAYWGTHDANGTEKGVLYAAFRSSCSHSNALLDQ